MDTNLKPIKLKPSDFKFYRILGNGSFAHVISAKFISKTPHPALKLNELYALKIVSKIKLLVNKKKHVAIIEKKAIQLLDHPNIIKLLDTFQDETSLYFVLELTSPITLKDLSEEKKVPVKLMRSILAETVNALEYIHSQNIIHRDIKPENILLCKNGQVKITDFGCAKILNDEEEFVEKESSLIGTPHYISPEIVRNEECCFETDLWSLGCTFYASITGKSSPFTDKNIYTVLANVVKGEIDFPEDFDSDAKDLISKMVVLEPCERLGSKKMGGFKAIKKHPFFNGIDFDQIEYFEVPFLEEANRKSESFGGFGSEENSEEEFEFPVTQLSRDYDLDLREGEKVLFSGIIEKRKSIINHRRELVLTNRPRLMYFDTKSGVMKGEVNLMKAFNIEEMDNSFFVIRVPGRDYRFKSVTESSLDWVMILNSSVIKSLTGN